MGRGTLSPRRAATVLVADDEPAVRNVTALMLEAAGYTVVTAADGAEAVERFAESGEVDCVVLDLTMPGLDGGEVVDRVRAQRPGIPVVLTSGYDGEGVAARLGAGFLQKPYSGAQLVEALATALGEPS